MERMKDGLEKCGKNKGLFSSEENENIFHMFYHVKVLRPVGRKNTLVNRALSSLHGGSFKITLSFFTGSVPGILKESVPEILKGSVPGILKGSVPGIPASVYPRSLKGVYPGSLKGV